MDKIIRIAAFIAYCCCCCVAIASTRTAKMIGGSYANSGEFPYQVSLRKSSSSGMSHFCGGSLLTRQHVLTAAHCVDRYVEGGDRAALFDSLTVKVGSTSLLLGGEMHQLEKIRLHDQYDYDTVENDVAVIKLSTEVELSNLVKPVKLSTKRNFAQNASMLISGFGSIYPGDPIKGKHMPSLNLRKLAVPAMTREVCRPMWQDRRFTEAQFCTSTRNRVGTCIGDSGSPILYEGEQFGIVSFGGTECAGRYPNICTMVAYYADFIERSVREM